LTGEIAMAFATGLLGSFGHCLPMCGPLVGSFALAAGPRGTARALQGQLAYHAGRITTYALVGAAMGLTGSFVNVAGRLAGLTAAAGVLAGAVMIAMGVGAAGFSGGLVKRLEARAAGKVSAFARSLLEGGAAGRLYPLGLVLGLLPCGLSWTLFLGAAGTGSPARGLLLALVFGLGTLPALLAAGAASSLFGFRARGALYRAGGLLVAALGLVFLLRGLGLRVPFPA
jgi:sulfite exporter TauE/SafE